MEIESILKNDILSNLDNIKLIEFIRMASFTTNGEQVSNEFKELKTIFDTHKIYSNKDNIDLQIISMGMSGDYQIAIKNISYLF